MVTIRSFSFEEIQELTLEALKEILAHPVHKRRFIETTGVNLAQIKEDFKKPEFLGAILDYMMEDEAFMKDFADSLDLEPSAITLARLRLPGAPLSH